jgi:hypothetical protein
MAVGPRLDQSSSSPYSNPKLSIVMPAQAGIHAR